MRRMKYIIESIFYLIYTYIYIISKSLRVAFIITMLLLSRINLAFWSIF